MLKLSRDWLLGLAVVAACVAYTLPVPVFAKQKTNEIYACVQNNGQIRLVDASEACKRNEERVTWGIRGPQGPPGNIGPVGPTGPTGEQGKQGLPGNIGPAGPAGKDGRDGAPGMDGAPGQRGADGAPGPGTGVIIGQIDFSECTIAVDTQSMAVHVLNTNLFAPVRLVVESGGDVLSGNTSAPPKKTKKKKVVYAPFQLYGVPPGRWTIEAGHFNGPAAADGFGMLTAYPRFAPTSTIANVVVESGGITNVGSINLDPTCTGEPIDVCGNGLDENGNGLIDENCPAIGTPLPPAPVCEELGLTQCADGTCRDAATCPTAFVPPPPDDPCADLVCGLNQVCAALKGGTPVCVCEDGYIPAINQSGSCVPIKQPKPGPAPAPAPDPVNGSGSGELVVLPSRE